mmetsp:Transcript_26287/g.4560  ORF Transcript_26287/g.4560 Transcript_26287/m.4560 type:complete len:103 (+) Transcript_26287:4229-4537(+)
MPDATKLTGDHCIVVQLPRQYNTNLSRGNESISCTLHTQNLADSSDDLSEVAVNGLSSCATGDNRISMCMPSGSDNEFGNTTRLYYRISNLANPEWGLDRNS